jgi:hypothetical protein
MDKNHQVYTPQINEDAAFMLRRVAWAAERPMTSALNACVQKIVSSLDRRAVCSACQDRRCLECPISWERRRSELDCILK